MLSDKNDIKERENHRVFRQLLNTFLGQEENTSKRKKGKFRYRN